MSEFVQKPGSWNLFRNNKKTADNQPDYRGTITLGDGTVLELSAWLKEGKNGKFFSGTVREPYQKPAESAPPPPPAAEEDCPF
jgi:hypothetical protein